MRVKNGVGGALLCLTVVGCSEHERSEVAAGHVDHDETYSASEPTDINDAVADGAPVNDTSASAVSVNLTQTASESPPNVDAGLASVSTDSSATDASATSEASNPYLPTGPAVPVEGDGRLAVPGSFETNLGFGWDFCGCPVERGLGAGGLWEVDAGIGHAADGDAFVHFVPPIPSDDPNCSDTVNAPFAFWIGQYGTIVGGEPLHIYFDAVNLSEVEPDGAVTFAGLEPACETAERWSTVPLSDLALSKEWETRCVTLHPTTDFTVFGFWMSGIDYSVGVDAVRFGPPCDDAP